MLRFTGSGSSARVFYTEDGDGNAHVVEREGRPFAVTLGEFYVLSAAQTPPGALTFAEWAGCTGDVQDGVLRLKGPFTRCTVTAQDGSAITVDRPVSASQYVYVDVASMVAWLSSSASAWTPGSTRVLLDYPAEGPLRLTPSSAGVVLTVSGVGFVTTGTTAETSAVALRGRKWWL